MHMLLFSALAAVVLGAGLGAVQAEDAGAPPLAGAAPAQVQPLISGSAVSAPAAELPPPLPLMPEATPDVPGAIPSVQAAKPTPAAVIPVKPPLKGSVEQLRQSIRIRELETQVLNADPSIGAWRQVADSARTPNGFRAAMRNYYTLLFSRIEALDPSLKATVENILYQQLVSLEQPSLKPAKLIENIAELPGSHSAAHAPPTPTPKPSVSPTPLKNSKPTARHHSSLEQP